MVVQKTVIGEFVVSTVIEVVEGACDHDFETAVFFRGRRVADRSTTGLSMAARNHDFLCNAVLCMEGMPYEGEGRFTNDEARNIVQTLYDLALENARRSEGFRELATEYLKRSRV